jgi:hypothetical protein
MAKHPFFLYCIGLGGNMVKENDFHRDEFLNGDTSLFQSTIKRLTEWDFTPFEICQFWRDFKIYLPLRKKVGRKEALISLPEDSFLRKVFCKAFGF